MSEEKLKNAQVKLVDDKFAEVVEPLMVKYFNEKIKELNRFIRAYESRYQKMLDSHKNAAGVMDMVELQRDFKKSLFELLTKYGDALEDIRFENFLPEIEEAVGKITAELKKTIIERKKRHPYPIKRTDHPLVFFAKLFENTRISTNTIFKKGLNFFRILFKKQPADLTTFRRRRIPFRNMAQHYLQHHFLQKNHELLQLMMKSRSELLLELWTLDDKVDDIFQDFLQKDQQVDSLHLFDDLKADELFESIKGRSQDTLNEIKTMAAMMRHKAMQEFDAAFSIVDTLELPSSKFNPQRVKRTLDGFKQNFSQKESAWKNTHFTLYDDWTVDVEITLLYYSVYDAYNQMTERVKAFIATDLAGSFDDIRKFIKEANTDISKSETTKKAITETLTISRKNINNILIDKLLSQNIEKLTACFDDDFEQLINKTLQLVEKVSDKRAFIRSRNYLRGISSREISWISPRELLNFEALPRFRNKVNGISQQIEQQLEKARVHLLGLGTVCDFSLESAIIMLEQKEGSAKKALKTSQDGLERALAHLLSVEDIVEKIHQTISDDLSDTIIEFNNNILKLKDTENIFELNLKIVRIKTLEKSRQYKAKTIAFFKQLVPKGVLIFKEIKYKSIRAGRELGARIGLAQEKKQVSFELSEFIGQTQATLKKLPYVYQRLYQLNPTDEDRFFVNREKEIKKLEEALDNWNKDRFITVALIGVKGSGITSLINYFLRHNKTELKLLRKNLDSKIYLTRHYFDFFNRLIGEQNFETNEQIIEYLNTSSESHIIVIENMHHMFLKRVHGFDCHSMFFDLMSNTMKKVLWIGTYTPHAWEYLDKTIFITNYFTNEIYLEPLNAKTIAEIIFKRNRLSGYHIDFQPNKDNLENKSFLKMNDIDRQKYLHKQYFDHLSRMSSGNITLAQLYWLRSTKKVSDEAIEIGALTEIDFSFIKSLSGDDLFTLQALILHDGLTLEDFSLMIGKPQNAARNMLIPMLEKGLLIRPKEKFNINPIIFSPLAAYLTSRNFIN